MEKSLWIVYSYSSISVLVIDVIAILRPQTRSGRSLWALRSFCALWTLWTLGAGHSNRSLRTFCALWTLWTLGAGHSYRALRTFIALWSLRTLGAGHSYRALRTFIALWSLRTFRTGRALGTLNIPHILPIISGPYPQFSIDQPRIAAISFIG